MLICSDDGDDIYYTCSACGNISSDGNDTSVFLNGIEIPDVLRNQELSHILVTAESIHNVYLSTYIKRGAPLRANKLASIYAAANIHKFAIFLEELGSLNKISNKKINDEFKDIGQDDSCMYEWYDFVPLREGVINRYLFEMKKYDLPDAKEQALRLVKTVFKNILDDINSGKGNAKFSKSVCAACLYRVWMSHPDHDRIEKILDEHFVEVSGIALKTLTDMIIKVEEIEKRIGYNIIWE